MDIRIECVAGAQPTWKVFIGPYFWSCDSQQEAEEWAAKAEAYVRTQRNIGYRLPSPLSPIRRKSWRAPQPWYNQANSRFDITPFLPYVSGYLGNGLGCPNETGPDLVHYNLLRQKQT